MNGHSDVVGAEEDGTITFNEETRCYEEVKDHHPLTLSKYKDYVEHSNPTQEMQVIAYLKSHDGITQREANIVLSVGRLSARIYNLIHRDGYDIDKKMITVKNQFGKKCSVAKYFLKH